MRGFRVLALVAVALGYSLYLLNVLPQWNRLVAAEGGREVQSRLFADPRDVSRVLSGFDASLRHDALVFYALDVPNFLLLAAAAAGLMAFGLRRLNLARPPYAWVLILPLLGAAADAIENASLALALLLGPGSPALSTVAATATSAKLIIAYDVSLPLVALLTAAGLAAWGWRAARSGRHAGR